MKDQSVLIKDQECATCEYIFKCSGKPAEVSCLNYKERDNGGKANVRKNNSVI